MAMMVMSRILRPFRSGMRVINEIFAAYLKGSKPSKNGIHLPEKTQDNNGF
jgi:hypothetical protein